ncbi:pentapeptide repeat-containing protein [Clostridium cadaveris]|uniref:pentapeptide repeat-containing protein n=1 Tax=Clostridium cadaveris TaxID=1529 RepID=UPI001459D485|nr:pentapeptide repeat-containing protein [Clostridium cadaveris]NME66185.1 pentapeptide repeat-containing protein [Clostridium cadaveris]UFH65806.1 hypothetical protein KQH81_04515 [Clostridium cadaveris]
MIENLQEKYNEWRKDIEKENLWQKFHGGSNPIFTEFDSGEKTARMGFSEYAELENEVSFEEMFELENDFDNELTKDEYKEIFTFNDFEDTLTEENYDYSIKKYLTIENAYDTYIEGWKLSNEEIYIDPNQYMENNKEAEKDVKDWRLSEKEIEELELKFMKKDIEKMMDNNYEGFIKGIISIEKGVDDLELLDNMYQEYMKSEFNLINDKFNIGISEREIEKTSKNHEEMLSRKDEKSSELVEKYNEFDLSKINREIEKKGIEAVMEDIDDFVSYANVEKERYKAVMLAKNYLKDDVIEKVKQKEAILDKHLNLVGLEKENKEKEINNYLESKGITNVEIKDNLKTNEKFLDKLEEKMLIENRAEAIRNDIAVLPSEHDSIYTDKYNEALKKLELKLNYEENNLILKEKDINEIIDKEVVFNYDSNKVISQKEIDKMVKDHEEWLNSNGEKGKRLDLEGKELKGLRILNVNLKEANLSNTVIQDSVIFADLNSANFTGAKIDNTKFLGSNIETIKIDSVNLKVINKQLKEEEKLHKEVNKTLKSNLTKDKEKTNNKDCEMDR